MNFFGRLLFLVGSTVVIGLALWFSLALFGLLLVVGGIAVIGFAARQFLIDKGILNPKPGIPMDASPENVTVIEADYKEIAKEQGDKRS